MIIAGYFEDDDSDELTNNPAGGAKSTSGRYVITGWGLLPN